MTGREQEQYALDVAQFGDRVAYWLQMEATGWSALYELLYWADVRRQCGPSYKEPHYWQGSNAA